MDAGDGRIMTTTGTTRLSGRTEQVSITRVIDKYEREQRDESDEREQRVESDERGREDDI